MAEQPGPRQHPRHVHRAPRGRRRSLGATLIELVAAIVIIAIALLGLTLLVANITGRSSDPLIEHQAGAIAQAYMDEAMLANFCDPDFLTGGQTCRQQCVARACDSGCGGSGIFKEASRALYDDVCDYAGLNDNGAHDRSGSALGGLAAYAVKVRVQDAGIGFGNPPLNSDAGQVVRIDVEVSHPGLDRAFTFSAFRANSQ